MRTKGKELSRWHSPMFNTIDQQVLVIQTLCLERIKHVTKTKLFWKFLILKVAHWSSFLRFVPYFFKSTAVEEDARDWSGCHYRSLRVLSETQREALSLSSSLAHATTLEACHFTSFGGSRRVENTLPLLWAVGTICPCSHRGGIAFCLSLLSFKPQMWGCLWRARTFRSYDCKPKYGLYLFLFNKPKTIKSKSAASSHSTTNLLKAAEWLLFILAWPIPSSARLQLSSDLPTVVIRWRTLLLLRRSFPPAMVSFGTRLHLLWTRSGVEYRHWTLGCTVFFCTCH